MLENAYGICIELSQRKLSENINGSNDIHTSQLAARLLILISTFGIKWIKRKKINILTKKERWIDHNMIERYKLVKNVPDKYLHEYNRKQSFNMDYEDEELLRARS